MEKIEAYTKTKLVSANQSSSVPTYLKPPIVPLKTTTQKNIDDFLCTSPKFNTVIPITNQNKQSSFTEDSNNISNPGIETIIQASCLSLASENTCETPKIVATDAFIDELIEGKEAVAAVDSQTEDSIKIILQKDIESHSLPPIDALRFDGDPSKWQEFIHNFKIRVHMKVTFNDSMGMEILHSILVGDVKKAVSSIGTNSIF